MSKTYTAKQVAQALGFSTNTVYKYLDDGTIKATRLGTEGRFRIPESEVIRLLGAQGKLPAPDPVSPSPTAAATSPTPVPETSAETIDAAQSILHHVSSPDLFDWFLGLASVFLALTYFLYPITYQSVSAQSFVGPLTVVKLALLPSSLLLLALDIFHPGRKLIWRVLSHLPLTLSLTALSFIYSALSEHFTAAFIFPLAAFAALSIFWYRSAFMRFLCFILVFQLSVIAGFLIHPEPIFALDITIQSFNYLPLVLVGLGLLAPLFFGLAWLASKKLPQLLPLILWPQAVTLLVLCVNFTANQAWNKATVSLILGTFTLLLPFYQSLTSLSRLTRIQAMAAFGWLAGITLVGSILVYVTQNSFRSLLVNQASQNLNSASQVIENFLDDSVRVLSVISQSPLTPKLIAASDTAASQTQLSQLVKETFLASPSLRRVTIADSVGTPLATYPLPNTSPANLASQSLANQDYFTQSRATGRTVVSQVAPPTITDLNPTIYVSIPLTDSQGQFAGAVIGSLDLSRLTQRLSDLRPDSQSYYVIADTQNRLIYHPDPSQIGQPAAVPSPVSQAVSGQSGSTSSYTADGFLSLQAFSPLSRLGWGISLIQPYSSAFRFPSLISFGIFLVTLICGSGSLAAVSQLRRDRS
ncbi:MAG: hypothetical protein A2854_00815 [Parcubacteria group bacterium RIFCSPHIGHO2_01_FULL_56_18]|nr:MAG: hypothetical protein A2854_00815 [Parcubacteria group bacterium RIFCSPHIGHO2_01_FULL_56_18]